MTVVELTARTDWPFQPPFHKTRRGERRREERGKEGKGRGERMGRGKGKGSLLSA